MTDSTPAPEGGEAVDFRYAPASSWTAICHVDDPCKTLVREDGALLYGYSGRTWLTYAFDRVVELRLDGDHQPLAVAQRTERADSAVVETTIRYAIGTLTLRAFRHRRDERAFDVVEWAFTAEEAVDELLTGLHVEIFDRQARFTSGPSGSSARVYVVPDDARAAVDWWYDAHDPQAAQWRDPDGTVALQSVPQRLAAAQPSGFRPVAAFVTVREVVRGGESLAGALVVPLDGAEVPDLDAGWVSSALADERSYWAGIFPDGLPISVPDAGIQHMLEASARNLLQAREVRDGMRVFQVGHAIYRGLWIADGYFILEAARYLGLDEAADESLGALQAHVADDGSIVALADIGHLKETAIAIATLVRQAELAGDWDYLDRWWDVIDRAVEHIAALHRSSFDLPDGSPARGLLPPAFGDGGVAGRRAEYTTILWALVGLDAVTRAATLAGRPQAERHRQVLAALRDAFERHRARHLRRLPDGRAYLPMVLDGGEHTFVLDATVVPPEHRIRPETATWALAQAIWPGELFATDSDIVQDFLHLLDLRDDAEGIPATTGWLPYRALWTYYASFAAHVWLFADRPDKAVAYLYAFANHAAPTRVWREEQPLRDAHHGQINGDMPHNWASAELIRLVRNLLVFERAEELLLLAGLPRRWTAPGCVTELRDSPTRFGRVTLRVERADDGAGTIEVAVKPGLRAPARCLVHVPEGRWEVRSPATATTVTGPVVVELATEAVAAA